MGPRCLRRCRRVLPRTAIVPARRIELLERSCALEPGRQACGLRAPRRSGERGARDLDGLPSAIQRGTHRVPSTVAARAISGNASGRTAASSRGLSCKTNTTWGRPSISLSKRVGAASVSCSTSPVISGLVVDGQTLTTSDGEWSGTPPITYGYQWRRCDATGADCSDLAGATDRSYTLTPADVGASLRARVLRPTPPGATTAALSPRRS